MSRSIVEQALHELAANREWNFDGLDEDGCAILDGGDDIEVVLTFIPGTPPVVVLYAELGEPVDVLATCREALRAMHLWCGDDNVTLGVHPDRDSLTACMALPIDADFDGTFAAAFDHFCARAAHWAHRLASGDAQVDAAPADPVTSGLDVPGHGTYRV